MSDLSFNLWPGWNIDHVIGSGSYGKVYEIHRRNGDYLEKAALKVMRIPQDKADLVQLRMDGLRDENTEAYFARQVEQLRNEIGIMQRFVGNSNIVSYEDYRIDRHKSEISWDILIRMELLTPLPVYLSSHPMSEDDVIRLGKDICHALSLCHEAGIIHRDIKPQNIFVSKWGSFKLGDFGIARTMPGSGSVLSFKGTISYMAPETFKMLNTDARSDIYSLALVLYQILNGGREPFLASSEFTLQDKEEAQRRRISGEVIPPPEGGSRKLWDVLSIALREDPSSRYQTAEAFCDALELAEKDCKGQTHLSLTKSMQLSGEKKSFNEKTSKVRREKQNRLSNYGKKEGNGFLNHSEKNDNSSFGKRTNNKRGDKKEGINKLLLKWFAGVAVILLLISCTAEVTLMKLNIGSESIKKRDSEDEEDGNTNPESNSDEEESEADSYVSYSYSCVDTDGNTIKQSDSEYSGENQVGVTMVLTAPEIEGYTLIDENKKELTLSENEDENHIVFTYSKEPDSVVYNTNGIVRILNRKSDKKREFDYLAKRFEKESGIKVSVETPGAGNYNTVLKEQITGSGNDPTLFMLSGKKEFENYEYECFDLTDSAAAAEICSEAYTLKGADGKTYGLACILEAFGIAVNTRLLSKAGYEVEDIQSFADLKEIAEDISARRKALGFAAFTTPTISKRSTGYYRLSQHASVVPLFYELQDNDFHTDRKLEGTYMYGLQNYIDLCLENAVGSIDEAEKYSLEDSRQEFIEGKAVFHQDGSWGYKKLYEELGEDIDVIPMYMGIPGEEKQALNETCSYYWCVNKYASYDDVMATLQFLQWLVTSEEGLEIMEKDMDFQIPFKKAHVPDNIFLRKLQEQKDNGMIPVLQYYNMGSEESWTNAMTNTIEDYASGISGWDAVKDAFTSLW